MDEVPALTPTQPVMEEDPKNMDMDDEDFDDENDDGWEECDDNESAGLSTSCSCLFCPQTLSTAEDMFSHCKQQHQFNIADIVQRHNLDCFGYIKLVNFVRAEKPSPDSIMQNVVRGQGPWMDDKYMKPVIEDDALLQYDIEDLPTDLASRPNEEGAETSPLKNLPDGDTVQVSHAEMSALLERLRVAEDRAKLAEEELECITTDMQKMRSTAQMLMLSQASEPVPSEQAVATLTKEEDDVYFGSYGHFSIHKDMLQDKVRTESYRDAIYKNTALFKDKVVLDIGCGTGILSMFAAKAGAKKVIAVDQSDVIYQAMDIVRENGLEDKITLVKGKMEDVDLPVDQVDIIVSEWMGYLLLFESMLDTVLWARDRYLNPDSGVLLPSSCSISIAALADPEGYQQHYSYWDNVYGFHMTCMKEAVMKEASVTVVSADKLATTACVVKELDLSTCKIKDLDFTSSFKLTAEREAELTAIVGFFDIGFNQCSQQIYFSTSPRHTATHWKQTVFLLEKPIKVHKDESIDGQFICRKNRKDPRSLIITLSLLQQSYTYIMQ